MFGKVNPITCRAMIVTQLNQTDTKITLSPNRSASMRQTKVVIVAVSLFVLMIGIGWSLVGGYLVLPFAGLDVGLFAFFMYKVCNQTYEKQVITIGDQHVLIQSGKNCVERTTKLERPSAFLSVAEPESPTETIMLSLSDSKSRFELGSFLSDSDKVEARVALKQAGLREISEKWWKPLS